MKCSRKKKAPAFLVSKGFRYGFLVFFLTMFGSIIHQTWLVASGAKNLTEAIKLLWTFRVPWGWAYTAGTTADWVAQFSFGFYSLMLTSTIIGLAVMVLFKPRTWRTFCPMGTMTQMICKIREHPRGHFTPINHPEVHRAQRAGVYAGIEQVRRHGSADLPCASQKCCGYPGYLPECLFEIPAA